MFHRIARFLVLIAAVQILGGHWAVLQSVAWAQMLVEYAQSDSLGVAVAKTFDGDHPCSLCHTVSDGRAQEKKQEAKISILKLDAVLALAVQLPPAQAKSFVYPARGSAMAARTSTPPTPPPLA